MSTGAQQVFFGQKRILGLEDFDTRFMKYLQGKTEELFALTYSVGGVFVNQITFSAAGADKFTLDSGIPATDGAGHVLTLDAGLATDIQFENTIGVTYFVGLRFATRPRGIQKNPRTGLSEFQIREETIGDSATPDAVVNLGPNLEFTVDSVTEPGVNNAGRQILVYKNAPGPNATAEAVAIESATVVWDGVNNKIVTAGNFGQVGIPSTTPSDYTVVLLGPTVKRNTDLSAQPNNAFIGTVVGTGAGNPPVAFDITAQNRIDTTLTGLDDITRVGTNLDLKVSVDAHPLDVGENQIEVLDAPGGVPVFSVDEAGNVQIKGDLTVTGTETVQNVETVQTNQIIGDNLIAGDSDADAHTFHGSLTHVSTGFGGTTFQIDGVTGAITLAGTVSANTVNVSSALNMLAGSNLGLQNGSNLNAQNGSKINVQSAASLEMLAGSALNVASGGFATFNAGSFLQIANGGTVVFFPGAKILGDVVPLNPSQNIGSAIDPWLNLFLEDGQIHLNDSPAGSDQDRILFKDNGTINFALRANFTGTGNNNDIAWNSPNGQLWVMNRIGEAVWGTGVTDADLVASVQMRIKPQAGHTALNLTGNAQAGIPLLTVAPNSGIGIDVAASVNEGIHVGTTGEVGILTDFNSADASRVPVPANTALKIHNSSLVANTGAFIDLRNDGTQTVGGYLGSIAAGGNKARLVFGTRTLNAFVDPGMWVSEDGRVGFGVGTAIKLGTALSGKVELLAEVAGTVFATHQLPQSILFNSSLVASPVTTGLAWRNTAHAANASHIFIGDRASLSVNAAMQRPVSVFYEGFGGNGILPTAFAEYSSWDFTVALGNRGKSAGLLQLAGVNFTNPSDNTLIPLANRAALLSGRNWNDSILARGAVDVSVPGIVLTNNQWKNVASVTSNGQGDVTINFDTAIATNYTVLACAEDVPGAEPAFRNVTITDRTALGFRAEIQNANGAPQAQGVIHFMVVGKPSTTVTW